MIALLALTASPASASWSPFQQLFAEQANWPNNTQVTGAAAGSRLILYASQPLEDYGGQRQFGRWLNANGSLSSEFAISSPTTSGERVMYTAAKSNDAGTICVAWVEGNENDVEYGKLRVRQISAGRTLGPVVNLGDRVMEYAPRVGIDMFGQCVVGWATPNADETATVVRLREIGFAGPTGPARTLNDPAGDQWGLASLRVSPVGRIAAVMETFEYSGPFSDYRVRMRLHRLSTWNASGDIVEFADLHTDGASYGDPEATIGAFGQTLVIWPFPNSPSFGDAAIRATRIGPSGDVTDMGVIATAYTNSLNSRMTYNSAGDGLFVWEDYVGGTMEAENLRHVAIRTTPNGAVGEPFEIEPPRPGNVFNTGYGVATDDANVSHFATTKYVQGPETVEGELIQSRVGPNGTVFDRGERPLPGIGYTDEVSVAANTCGRAVAAFNITGAQVEGGFEMSGHVTRSSYLVGC